MQQMMLDQQHEPLFLVACLRSTMGFSTFGQKKSMTFIRRHKIFYACVMSVQSRNLVGANLREGIGKSLGSFSSLTSIDLSNNRLGGSIPTSWPITLVNLSAFTGMFLPTK